VLQLSHVLVLSFKWPRFPLFEDYILLMLGLWCR